MTKRISVEDGIDCSRWDVIQNECIMERVKIDLIKFAPRRRLLESVLNSKLVKIFFCKKYCMEYFLS